VRHARGRHGRDAVVPLRRGSSDQAGPAPPRRGAAPASAGADAGAPRRTVGRADAQGRTTGRGGADHQPARAERQASRGSEEAGMKGKVIRSAPSWRKEGVRFVRPELWLVALGVVSALLVEVSQSARVAEISMELDKTRSTLQSAQARLEFERAELDR